MMTRKTAIASLFALFGSRAIALSVATSGGTIQIDTSVVRYHFAAKEMRLVIDGREITLTAKEIADALGAK